MTHNIAFFADSHLGYRTTARSTDKGINTRVQDGYDAFKETVKGIIESEVPIDSVVHGGDLTHTSHPSVRDIAIGNFYLRKLAAAGIPFYGVAGNHDSNDTSSDLPSVAAFHDPDRNINMVHDPYKQFEIADGLMLHAMSHHGMHENQAPDINVRDDVLNIFTTHGAALDPKNQTLLRCIDSPREQIIPVELITDGMFDACLLGHYHNRHAVGGEILNTWYNGSAIRRGFTDDAGPRGWLLVSIEPNGEITITPQNINQRPQFDLKLIDAEGLTPTEFLDMIDFNLDQTRDLEQAPIVRQRVKNMSRGLRNSIDHQRLSEMKAHTLVWKMEPLPSETLEESDSKVKASLTSRHGIDIIDNYKRFTESSAQSVPEKYRDIVFKSAEKYLAEARDLSELTKTGH